MSGGRLGRGGGYSLPSPETASDRQTALEQAILDFHNSQISGAWVSSEFVPFHWANCYRRYIAMIYQQERGIDVEPVIAEMHRRAALGRPVNKWKVDSTRAEHNA